MPTPSEQKALAFVAIVFLLGGAVRALRAGSLPAPTPLERQALARQATAVESATNSPSAKRKKGPSTRKLSRSARDTVAKIVAGVASVPATFARPDDPFSHRPYGSQTLNRWGFPPPGPRIDIGPPPRQAGGLTFPASGRLASRPPPGQVDIDAATAAELEKLPRIGPALAGRIVANRDSLGPFGSLQELGRVKGMGKATLQGLASLVTFSGRGLGTPYR